MICMIGTIIMVRIFRTIRIVRMISMIFIFLHLSSCIKKKNRDVKSPVQIVSVSRLLIQKDCGPITVKKIIKAVNLSPTKSMKIRSLIVKLALS